ncbi:hypothetical protein GEMRC1_002515 [Eukaryota sp. GEM-RC1]
MEDYVLGIDFGTTFSSVAVYRPHLNTLEPISSEFSDQCATPSVIRYDPDGNPKVLVGRLAKERLHRHPESTFYDTKDS